MALQALQLVPRQPPVVVGRPWKVLQALQLVPRQPLMVVGRLWMVPQHLMVVLQSLVRLQHRPLVLLRLLLYRLVAPLQHPAGWNVALLRQQHLGRSVWEMPLCPQLHQWHRQICCQQHRRRQWHL